MSSEFDQAEYWRKRHRTYRDDPRSVGNLAATIEQNRQGELELQTAIRTLVPMLGGSGALLDLGCGYGRVAGSVRDAGYAYRGVDVSPEAVSAARARHPDAEFDVGDLALWDTSDRYDVVMALYVLVHIVDDAVWASLLERAASWIKPGGALLLADVFPTERQSPVVHVVSRPLAAYAEHLGRMGLTYDASFREALTSLADDGLRTLGHFHLWRK